MQQQGQALGVGAVEPVFDPHDHGYGIGRSRADQAQQDGLRQQFVG